MSNSERHMRLFRNGHSQALRIPREFELEGEDEGDETIIHREGDRLIVEPVRTGRLLELPSTMVEPLDKPLPEVDEDLPPLVDIKL